MNITGLLIPANSNRAPETVKLESLNDAYDAINAVDYGRAIDFAPAAPGESPLEFIVDDNGLAADPVEINTRALVIRKLERVYHIKKQVGLEAKITTDDVENLAERLALAMVLAQSSVMNQCLVGDVVLTGGVDAEGATISPSEEDMERISEYLGWKETQNLVDAVAAVFGARAAA